MLILLLCLNLRAYCWPKMPTLANILKQIMATVDAKPGPPGGRIV